jgi:peptidoglycan/LPS O-acetylase OafA/YrhL
LDGIRGLAFLCVFLAHTGLGFVIPGGFGVTIFFVLSGFLITTLLRLEYRERGSIDLKAFYLRRSLRILPLFYLVLGMAILVHQMGLTSGRLQRGAVLAQVFHWSNYYLIAHDPDAVVGGTIVLWSLAVEEHFYLLFPLFYWQIRKHLSRSTQVAVLWGACLLCLIWRCVLICGLHATTVRSELGTDTRFDGLLYGAILAIAANPSLDASRLFERKWLNRLAIVGVGGLLFSFVFRNETFRYTFRYTVQGISLLPLFAYAIVARSSIVFRFLNAKVMTQLGVLSYGLYLIHAVCLNIFSSAKPHAGFLAGSITLAVAITTAKVLQVMVERPMQRLRKRFTRVHA